MLLPPDKNIPSPRGIEAQIIVEWGARVFPGKPAAKTPAIAGWPEKATTDSAVVSQWWLTKDFNVCVATGLIASGRLKGRYLVVVDYDMKPGQKGAEALLAHELKGLSNTVGVRTPNGVHKYYWSRVPVQNSVSRIAPNVDVRGERGYVLGAMSIVGGVLYTREGEYSEIAELPAEFAALAQAINGHAVLEHSKAPIGELDHPAAIESGKRYLINDAPEAIEGSHGDATTFAVAARCKDLGLGEQMTLELMLAWWNDEKAIPPWAFDALRTKVANAYQYGRNPPGSADPRNEFDVGNGEHEGTTRNTGDPYGPNPHRQGQEESGSNGREPLKDESFADAAASARDIQSNPLVEGLIGQGELCAIYGPPGSGKTFVALDLAHAIATGTAFDGRKTAQGAVLYVAAEGGPGIKARILALQTRFGSNNPPIRLLRYPVDFRTGNYDAVRLCKLIEQRSIELGVTFLAVFIDTLPEALAGGNDTEHMQAFVYNAKLVQQRTGVTVVPVHHPGKDAAKGMRGHSSLVGAVDTAIEINAPQGGAAGAQRRLTVTKQRNMEIPANSSWFGLETIALGPNTAGVELASCVVAWSSSAPDEFGTTIAPADKALFETVERWAAANETDADEVTAAVLLKWVSEHEATNPVGKIKDFTLRKQLQRLREQGILGEEE